MPISPSASTTVTPSDPVPSPQGYDGTSPFPPNGPAPARDGGERLYVTVTAVIVVLPFVAIGLAGWLLWGSLIHPADIVLALVLYTITGLGVTVGFHRGFTHGGYRAVRPVRIALAVAGSMSAQGDVIGWIATHRRHHAFTDRPGDPHSPYRYGTHLRGQLRGLLHAHVGWPFRNDESWHNLHHADPTSARHGVDRGQLDPSAAVIRLLERLGWVHDVRWPTADRVAARRA